MNRLYNSWNFLESENYFLDVRVQSDKTNGRWWKQRKNIPLGMQVGLALWKTNINVILGSSVLSHTVSLIKQDKCTTRRTKEIAQYLRDILREIRLWKYITLGHKKIQDKLKLLYYLIISKGGWYHFPFRLNCYNDRFSKYFFTYAICHYSTETDLRVILCF